MRHELLTLAIVVVGIFFCVKGVMMEQMIERLPKWARGPAYLAATIVWSQCTASSSRMGS